MRINELPDEISMRVVMEILNMNSRQMMRAMKKKELVPILGTPYFKKADVQKYMEKHRT